jgi:tetratricopeptide (TPR) repeat protein
VLKSQLVLILIAILLLSGLYIFGKTSNPALIPANQAQANSGQATPLDFTQLLDSVKKTLPPATLLEINSLESGVIRGDIKSERIGLYSRLYGIWDSLTVKPIAAHYSGEAAKLENSSKSLTFAANLFLADLQHTEDPSLRTWEACEANTLLRQDSSLDPANDTIQVSLADSYVEGGDVMSGVKRLLDVTRKDPGNLGANLLLGRLSVMSGQYDKAVTRLQGIVDHYPDNTEALYFLAEAYKGKGDDKKAVALFERCKTLVNDTAFDRQIDDYIKSFEHNP